MIQLITLAMASFVVTSLRACEAIQSPDCAPGLLRKLAMTGNKIRHCEPAKQSGVY